MTQGAVWLEVSRDGSSTARFWRRWGSEALANPKPATRSSDYEDRGTVTFSVKGGKILFSSSSTAQTFYWELTPTGTPNSFLVKVTGGNLGTEGRLDCMR